MTDATTNKVNDFMTDDHNRLDGIFKEFRAIKKKDIARAKKLFAEFRNDLKRHIKWEDDILFPAFEKHTGMQSGGPTAVMRMEHRKIEEFLDGINAALAKGDASTDALEEGLLGVLGPHDVKEEGILYPWIDSSVPDEERVELFGRIRQNS